MTSKTLGTTGTMVSFFSIVENQAKEVTVSGHDEYWNM